MDTNFKKIISDFNHSELRRRLVPLELASGWPSIRMIDSHLYVTIPYFVRKPVEKGYALYPIERSVTVLYKNPSKLIDFTVFHTLHDWDDVDYSKPVGFFKHKALENVTTAKEYQALCDKLYDYYDEMIASVLAKEKFEHQEDMAKLFTILMEPSLYPYYLRINKKFYSAFCRL